MEFQTIINLVNQFEFLQGLPIVVLLAGLAFIIVAFNERKLTLFLLPIVYMLAIFPYVTILPSLLAGVKLFTGLFVCLILVFAVGSSALADNFTHLNRAYLKPRIITAVVVTLVLTLIGSVGRLMLPALPETAVFLNLNILLLTGLGAVGIWLSDDIFSSAVGLLLFLIGFELYHAHLNQSDTIMLLFAFVNLSLALLVSYLLQATLSQKPLPMDSPN